ncbi:MFS transporter [Tardiphaga sp.]|uniref:MFS transporter n=1 Tax=Tardiphaga sp. TaxID=1926292 RepID=UPI00352B755C
MIERRTMRKVGWRIVPFLIVCYFIAFIDRVNIGFAALTMNADIGLSETAFGIGGSLFFIAYVLFEVPSNLAMERFGARIWIARIMVTWGIVGIGMAFIEGATSFYVARFLLGAAEAGFFPGAILYLSQWFPKAYRARIVATFMIAIPMSSFLGSPVAAALLSLDGMAGLAGWQWLFILESIPAILLGILALRVLPNRTDQETWLDPVERRWLADALASEHSSAAASDHPPLWRTLANGKVWALALIYCGSSATSNALSIWQPLILKSFGLSNWSTGLLNMIPFGVGAVFMIIWGRIADRTGERIWSTAIPLALTSTCLFATLATNSLWTTLLLLSMILIGNYAIKGPFWALTSETLTPATAAAGIAAVNTIAHIGTGGATSLIGIIRQHSGSFPVALLPLAILTATGAITTLILGRYNRSR